MKSGSGKHLATQHGMNSPACYIVAVVDVNHNGNIETAKRLIDTAVQSGADAVKFVKRTVGLAAVNFHLEQRITRFPTLGHTLRELWEKLELSADDLHALQEYKPKGLDFIVAPYDIQALRDLHLVEFDAIQIDPPSAANVVLLEAVAQEVSSPILACTDGCSPKEVEQLLGLLREKNVTILHGIRTDRVDCMAADLRFISWLRSTNRMVGYVDHGADFRLACVGMGTGAQVVEKRLTLSKTMTGPHHSSSLNPEEFSGMVKIIRSFRQDGCNQAPPEHRDMADLDFLRDERPSLVAARRIPKGSTITRDMLVPKAPMFGLSPSLIDYVVGKRAVYDIEEDQFITFGVISE